MDLADRSHGPTTSASSSASRPELLPEIVPAPAISAGRRGSTTCPTACRSPAWRATSRRRSSARGAWQPGQAKCTYGTGAFLLAHTGDRSSPRPAAWSRPLAATLGDGPPQYALEGSVFVAGAAVQWFRDGLKAVGAAPEIDRLCLDGRPGLGRPLRPRPDRPGRPALGARGPRHDLRPDPRHDRRRPRPRHPRRGRLPDRRPHRRHERRPADTR